MDNKVSIYDVARHIGVSAATVSYVINGVKKVSDKTREKVLNAIDELGYSPNYTARALSTGKSHLIGILLPLYDASIAFLQNPFYVEFMGGIEKNIHNYNYDLVIGSLKENESLGDWIKRRNIDGLILIGSHDEETYKVLNDVNVPVVLVDDDSESSKNFNNVRSNDKNGMYLSTKYLIDNGHKKIGFVGNPKQFPIDKIRYDGYHKAMIEAGLKIEDGFEFICDSTFDSGYKIAEDIIKRNNVTGVVCSADIIGIGIIKKYKELGLDVPNDLSVTGYDDIQNANYIYPGLTTIHQDIGEKGKKAAQILLDVLENNIIDNIEYNLEPYFVERNSVKNIK